MDKILKEWRKKLDDPTFKITNATPCQDKNHMIKQHTTNSGVKIAVYGKGEDQFTMPTEALETDLWRYHSVKHGVKNGKCIQMMFLGNNQREHT